MADDSKPPADDTTEKVPFEDPDKFESFDKVDADTVDLGEDSFDESQADFDGEH